MNSDVIGLVPAAGTASRLAGLKGSKELLRVWRPPDALESEPLPAIRCLLSAFEAAAVGRALIVVRTGKEDIPSALGPGTEAGLRLDYVVTAGTPSPPFTLDAVVPHLEGRNVVMGFPDILFEPRNGVGRLLERLETGDADAVVGLFPHPLVRRADVVRLHSGDRVLGVDPGGARPETSLTWGLAAWTPRFTTFLHEWVGGLDPASDDAPRLGVGSVINAAIAQGRTVRGLELSDVPFLDIGTPDALAEAYRRLG